MKSEFEKKYLQHKNTHLLEFKFKRDKAMQNYKIQFFKSKTERLVGAALDMEQKLRKLTFGENKLLTLMIFFIL